MANLTSLIQMLLVLLLSYATSVSCQCRTIATTPTFPDLFPNPLVLTSDTGMITSPNFPSNYNANEQCAWEIRGADDSNIMVTFEAFNTGTTSQLGFLTGESAFGGDAIVFPTGSTLPPVVNITDNVLGIAWATGGRALISSCQTFHRIINYN